MERKIYLNRYRLSVDQVGIPVVIRRSLGEATFQADNIETEGHVAVQVVPAAALRTAVREQLEIEARAAQQLKHINIPVLHDFGFDDDQLIYVTEYFDGTTAEDWVQAQGPMPSSVVLRIAAQVVSALGAATFHGIVHHALNPSNIMLVPGQTAEGEWPLIKVLNFVGVAPSLSTSNASGPAPMNPADFASPEQLESGEVDFRSQIYSLGCILWFLLKGAPPTGGAATVQNASGLAAPIRRLLMLMLAADPAERPLDPLAFHGQIQDCLAQIERRDVVAGKFGLPAAAAAAPPRPAKTVEAVQAGPRRAFPWKPLALAAVLFTIAALTAVVLAGRARPRQALGVPVGVPEATVAPAVASNRTAASVPAVAEDRNAGASTRQSAPMAKVPNPPVTPEATAPPVLTSTAVASSDEDTDLPTSEVATENDSQRSTQVAANDAPVYTPPVPTASSPSSAPEDIRRSAPLIANNSRSTTPAPEPAARAEGPSAESAQPVQVEPVQAQAVQVQPEVALAAPSFSEPEQVVANDPTYTRPAAAEEDVQKDVPISAVSALPEKSSKVTKVAKPSVPKVRVAAASNNAAPPLPRGSVRAQYLGTTPEGNLMFGLPSNERGYVSPAGTPTRAERRRARRAARDPLKELPVLPALPPDG